jgi:hypothetical protein
MSIEISEASIGGGSQRLKKICFIIQILANNPGKSITQITINALHI